METLPVWKRIYPVIASSNPHVTINVVENVLEICKEHITDVFLHYKSYTRESYVNWKQQLGLKEIISDDEMCNFIHNLSRELDLDANVAWTVICNFLMYEYYGKVDELKTLIKFHSKIEYLTENIWFFYSADRMFLLKTLKHILESLENENHIYQKQIESFAKTFNVPLLWKNLVIVFSNLILEISKDKVNMVPTNLVTEWVHRNNREQIEVILLLMHTVQLHNLKLTGSELLEILVIFIKHGFTGLPLYTESIAISRKQDLDEIQYAEVALVLTVINKYWHLPNKSKIVMLPENVEKNLELLLLQGDNSIVLFAWSIFKTDCDINGVKDFNMEHCNTLVEKMLEIKVFVSLYKLLTHKMFSESRAGEILVDAVYTLMIEFSKICADFPYLHEQPGVSGITAELLKRKGLVVLENLGSIFQLSMEAFPFVFDPFLEMCKSLINIPEKYDNVIKLLKEIPGFLAEIPWNDHRQKFTLVGPQKLFIDSDLFIVPSGTTVERFLYQGNEFARFHYPFSFFLLMEQFTKSLSTIAFEIGPGWYCYKNLTKLVHIGFNFINHLLKHYKGDYRNNNELRTLVQRLEIIPAQFCEGPVKNFDFIKLYFEVNCTLITNELLDYLEAFPPIQRKTFMPTVLGYSKKNRDALFAQLHNKCSLFKSLKDEEGMRNHSLLIQYLDLIFYMVKKNMYHYEVQLPGMWYIINCTLPLYQQWLYNDPNEKTHISKCCFSIFVEILQRHLSKVTDNSIVIFEMVLDSFLYEDIIMSSYMSMLSKDKFYLQSLMEQESNWTNGPTLESIECLRLQLVLLLLLFKHKAKSITKRNTLDENVGFFAKGVTPYIINPYSLSLRKLSCRFLEFLSRDQNIPLMALLGLDYDQVQRLYLDRLRDSTEDDDLKVHILDLIGTCVIYQHGMTAAFFNVKRSRKWYSDNKEKTIEIDTVSDFMVDYLHNVKKSPEFLRSPLQIGILHVMANLWSSQKKHLISEVIALKEFWPLLSNPLYREYDQLPKVYAFIFQIYGIQLVQVKNDPTFLSSVEKFVTDSKQVKLWMDYLHSTFKSKTTNVEDIEDRQFLLRAWMEFIIMLERCQILKTFNESNKFEFILLTLDGIQLPLVNTYCMNLWMEFLLLQLAYWKIPTTNQDNLLAMTRKGINTIKIMKLHYNDLDQSTRLSILTIIQHLLNHLHVHFEANFNDFLDFLEHFGPMFEYEYRIIEEKQWKSIEGFDIVIREQLLPWMMCVRIVNGLFEFKNIKDIGIWFTYRNVVQKFMNSTCELVTNTKTLPLTKMFLHSLALYANSSLHLDFLNVNTNIFFANIEPSITRLLYGQNNRINPLQLEEGWITCSLLIKFQTAYFQSLQFATLPSCYNFINLNEQILGHIFNILETTVALKALDLVQNTLVLFDSMLLKWHIEWYRKSNSTYNFVLNGVKKVINACLYAILRPKNIVVYLLDDSNRFSQMEKFPVELMVAVMNRLVTVAGLGFSILYRVNPDLINLFDVPLSDTMSIIIENDFSVPKFELPISNKLTYGMLLCLSHFLCKTLDALNLKKCQAMASASTTDLCGPTEDYFSRYFGMVEHQDFSDNLPTQKLSAFLRYAMYEYSGLADPWIQKLDFNLVKFSLESLMMFLAQQIFLAVKTTETENVSYFKRNLSSELQFFYEHIKKTTSVLINSTSGEQFSNLSRTETDILKRYLLHCKEVGDCGRVVDNNFCIIISYWFIHLCKLR